MQTITEIYIRSLPKAELHLHLEGSLTPALLHRLSVQYGTEIADSPLPDLQEQFFRYQDFYAFLRTYELACRHLRKPEDYLLVFQDLEEYFLREHILYAEVIYTPSIAWHDGRDGREILEALLARSADCETNQGTIVRWILDCVRQFGPDSAHRTARLAAEMHHRGVVAVGLGGDERSLPMKEFEEVYNWTRAHELFVHIHAGEIGTPQEVWDAVRILGANRIGHGIQAARDPKLMAYLREHALGLDICLTSNDKTRAWPLFPEHPFGLLFRRGVPVTLNTDDPGLFQTCLSHEYRKAAQVFDLSREDLHRLVLQAVHCAFLPRHEKKALMASFQALLHNLAEEHSS
jgi:adenosine deaminase